MADRYWRGGTGTWNGTNTANWSATSGGPGGASVPTANDMVFFNASSGTSANTVTAENRPAFGLNFTGATIRFVGATGNRTISLGSGASNGGLITGTTATFQQSVRVANVSSVALNATMQNPTGAQGGFNSSGNINITGSGTWSFQGSVIYCGVNGFTGTINTNNITWGAITDLGTDFNSNSGEIYTSGATLNFGTSTVYLYNLDTSGGSIGGNHTIYLLPSVTGTSVAASTVYNLTVKAGAAQTISVGTVSNNFNILAAALRAVRPKITLQSNLTVNGTFSCTSLADKPTLFLGDGYTLTATTRGTVSNLMFNRLTVAGTALSGTRLGNFGGNTNITFDAPTTKYAVGITGGTKYSQDNVWSTTSGGAPNTTPPLCQDDVVFDANSGSGTFIWVNNVPFGNNINGGYFILGSLTTGGYLGSFFIGGLDQVYFGGTLNLSNSNVEFHSDQTQLYWSNHRGNTSFDVWGGTTQATLPYSNTGSPSFWTFHAKWWDNAASPDLALNIRNNIMSRNISLFPIANVAINLFGSMQILSNGFNSDNKITLSSPTAGAYIGVLDGAANFQNLTVSSVNKPSILCSNNGITNLGSGKNYGTLYIANGSGYGNTMSVNSNTNTFDNIQSFTNSAVTLGFFGGTTNTFSNWNVKGSAGNVITIQSDSSTTTQHNLIYSGTSLVDANYLNLQYSNATPSTLTWYAGANSTNSGNNAGWIFASAPGKGNGLFFGNNF